MSTSDKSFRGSTFYRFFCKIVFIIIIYGIVVIIKETLTCIKQVNPFQCI